MLGGTFDYEKIHNELRKIGDVKEKLARKRFEDDMGMRCLGIVVLLLLC